ncbi:hypothetical protein HZF05_20705 [Sphingomonas sp. CGMCC 1.13654]|uniref:PilZ domain-containing protein n=1 Tax=Sphingomonas chungangi TaxID=2683589 RepID=A0A838LCY8_9SPHN|nr:hypothetical protein [Sphingomonas chungangi]MBA2936509.1 hypothetical protein [Sphingomonas chungangi]MVW55894.1 hypothetical protein [Sphingomonas chungangi]
MASGNWLAKDRTLLPEGRRPLCLLLADRPLPVALREVSGAGAWIETHARLDMGMAVTLRHPQAGTVSAEVIGQDRQGLHLRFDRSETSVAFALAVIATDMRKAG